MTTKELATLLSAINAAQTTNDEIAIIEMIIDSKKYDIETKKRLVSKELLAILAHREATAKLHLNEMKNTTNPDILNQVDNVLYAVGYAICNDLATWQKMGNDYKMLATILSTNNFNYVNDVQSCLRTIKNIEANHDEKLQFPELIVKYNLGRKEHEALYTAIKMYVEEGEN